MSIGHRSEVEGAKRPMPSCYLINGLWFSMHFEVVYPMY